MSVRTRLVQSRFKTPAEEAMVGLMVAAAHLVLGLEEVCASHGITHDQYNVLRILRGVHPDGHPRYAIAERLVDRAPDVTRLLDRLERQGLVERFRAPEDRRLSISRITDAGLELLAAMEPGIMAVHERHASALTSGEVKSLARICDKILGG